MTTAQIFATSSGDRMLTGSETFLDLVAASTSGSRTLAGTSAELRSLGLAVGEPA